MKNLFLEQKMKNIPKLPGCYLWKNSDDKVIYVGKAKNLYNRTHQYFYKNISYKINFLVDEIADIDYIVVSTANEALILENNLIKKYFPKYNTMLKDSSDYPYIVVTNDKVPKIIYTRKYNKYKGKHYGPLADSKFNNYELFKFLNEISPIKRDDILRDQRGIFFDIFCKKYPNQEWWNDDLKIYDEWRKFINNLFHGKCQDILDVLENMENLAVERLDFDHAEKYHLLIQSIQSLSTSQIVQLTKNNFVDYFCFYQENNLVSFVIFNYVEGKLISKHNSIHNVYDDINDVISSVVVQYYSNNAIPNEIIVSLNNEQLEELSKLFETKFSSPNSKQNQEIMQMGISNAKIYLQNNKLALERKLAISSGAANELAQLLKIRSANNIEAFDNSNINLQHSVSAMVCFKNGVASKKDYRRFNLTQTEFASDFHYMQEVIYRRYAKLINNEKELPDLIIVDGGKLQVNAALISLEKLELVDKVNLIGLKKDNHHKTQSIVLSGGSEIILDKKSHLFSFLTNIQDEVHRFAIEFYRSKHLKNNFKTFLDSIESIGPKTKKKIINSYPSLSDLKNVTLQELSQIIPKRLAILIKNKINEIN